MNSAMRSGVYPRLIGFLALLSCKTADAPPVPSPAAEPPPPALLGIWTVVSHSMPGVSAMSDAEADKWHGLSIRLLQAEAVSRSDRCVTPEYRSVADTLELSCGQGVWSAFGARMFAAGPDRVRALWDGVLFELERDQDLTAVGQEPGWFLELTQGKELRLIYAYGEKRVIIPAPPGTRDSSGAVMYRAKADSTDLAILVTRANCADAMSGKPYPMTVTVTVNGETLRGCGETMPVIDGIPIAKAALVTLRIPGFADFLALDGDGAWVTNEGRVERLVASESKPVATVPMGSPCGAMAVDFGSLWVADCKERVVVRIGLTSHNVEAKVATGLADPTGELSIATGAASVWILSDTSGKLARIDPATNTVIATIPVAAGSFAAVFGFGSVWITTTNAGSVQRVDPGTNTVVATIPVGPTPRFLAAGEGGVWTLNQGDGTVSRIDPATNTVSATIDASVPGGGGDIATGGGKVWVRARKVLLSVIDPRDNLVVRRYGPQAGSGAVRADSTRAWVTAHDTQEVWVLPVRQD